MTQRPYFLNLLRIGLPIGGVVSILHRASGALLSLLIPPLLYTFSLSLQSPAGYARVQGAAGWLLVSLLVWAGLHHFLAGLRHFGFDLGLGDNLLSARRSAWGVLALAILATIAWRCPV